MNRVGFEVLTAVFLGYKAVQTVRSQLTFRRNISPKSSAPKNKLMKITNVKAGGKQRLKVKPIITPIVLPYIFIA
jgi:hypothetical protein